MICAVQHKVVLLEDGDSGLGCEMFKVALIVDKWVESVNDMKSEGIGKKCDKATYEDKYPTALSTLLMPILRVP